MAAPNSVLYPSGLRKYIGDNAEKKDISLSTPRLDILFESSIGKFFGAKPAKQYTKEEKEGWWKQKEDKPFKIGLLHSKELDTRIHIFGEVFDFSKTANRNGTSNVNNVEDISGNMKKEGFDIVGDVEVEKINPPETFYTTKDFDKLYLGFLQDQKNEKIRRSSLKQLFRFVFGTKKLKDVKKFKTRLLITYTALDPAEKVPCESKLREDFKAALAYRRELLLTEIQAGTEAVGEQTLYMEKKRNTLMGLRDLLNEMEQKEGQCLVYGEIPDEKDDAYFSQGGPGGPPGPDEEDFHRLVKIFQSYVKSNKKYNSKNTTTVGRELYADILRLLYMILDPQSSLSTQTDVEDLTQMVEHLSFLLEAFAELHSIHISLKDIQISFEKYKLENLRKRNEDLELRIRGFVSQTDDQGTTDISSLLNEFSKSLLQQSQANANVIRQRILGLVEGKDQRIRDLERQLQESNNTLQKRETQIAGIQTQITTAETDLLQIQNETQNLRTEMYNLRLQLAANEGNLEEVQQTAENIKQEVEKLRTQVQGSEQQRAQIQSLTDLLEQSVDIQTQLQGQLQGSEQQRIQLQTQIQELQRLLQQSGQLQERTDLQGQLQERQTRIQTLETERTALQTELQERQTELTEQQTQLLSLQQERTTLQTQLQEAHTITQNLDELIQQLQSRSTQLQKEKGECEEQLRKSQGVSEERIQEFRNHLRDLTEELGRVTEEANTLQEQKDQLQAEKDQRQTEHDAEMLRVQAEKQAIEVQLKANQDPERIAALEQQLQTLEGEREQLIEDFQKDMTRIQTEVQSQLQTLQQSHEAELGEMVTNYETQKKSFEDTQKALQEATNALGVLREAKGETDKSVQSLLQQIETIQTQHTDELERAQEAANKKLADLSKELSTQQAQVLKQRMDFFKEEEQKRKDQIRDLESRLASQEDQERVQEELNRVIGELQEQLAKKDKQLDDLIAFVEESQGDNQDLESQIALLQAENNALRLHIAELTKPKTVFKIRENKKEDEESSTSGYVRTQAKRINKEAEKAKFSPTTVRKPWAVSTKSSAPSPTQYTGMKKGGGLQKEKVCETMLTLLLLHLKNNNFDVQEFLDKAGATLDDLGQCPIVLHVLNQMLDEAEEVEEKEKSIVYSSVKGDNLQYIMKSIEDAVQSRFTEEEQDALAGLSKPLSFYSTPPEEYSAMFGSEPYMLLDNAKDEEANFEVLGDSITLTKDEREKIENGGISLGALTFLYLTCVREIQERNESPTSSSKCLFPNRTLERAKTPKVKHQRKVKAA